MNTSKPIVSRIKAKITFKDGHTATRYSYDKHYSHHFKAYIKDESIGWEKLKKMVKKWGDKIDKAVFYISLEETPMVEQRLYNTCIGGFHPKTGITTDMRFTFCADGLVSIHKFR